jgi:excisionase family DNA binding protein
MERALYTVPEAADCLRCSRLTVYRAVWAGRLQAVRLGAERGPVRIPNEVLEAFLLPETRPSCPPLSG